LHENAIFFPLCSKFACDQAPKVRPWQRDECAAQISNVSAPLKLHEQCDHVTAHVKEDLFSKACHLTTVMMEDNGSRLVTTLPSMREYPMPKFGILRASCLSCTEPLVEQSDTTIVIDPGATAIAAFEAAVKNASRDATLLIQREGQQSIVTITLQ